jgi:hypothetical protein
MPQEVRVVRRNLRWEVRVDGVARPRIDWFCTRERALEHARERAREVEAGAIVVEGADWITEEIVAVEQASGRFAVAHRAAVPAEEKGPWPLSLEAARSRASAAR